MGNNCLSAFKKEEPDLIRSYYKIKKECQFQISFSGFLVISFFILQYSVPISLVILGSITTSRDQISLFLRKSQILCKDPQKTESSEILEKKESDILVGKIIFILGILTILLGVINNTVKPAESYDTSAKFNSKFSQFQRDLDLHILNQGGLENKKLDTDEFKTMCCFLLKISNDLTDLINQYNEARSLNSRQANLQSLKNQENKDELKIINSASSKSIDCDNANNKQTNDPT
ncbi:hypothetical protein PN450_08570 [Dolichospermum lemmermannii CS-548]|uniref:hypothetical protein n=1 Tax=Dolichospermum lemmermannii TaxID=54295 RepID=UPI00232CD54B|nr:hypothetical protein [Dolichospermum lemmermannii]MDB9436857.1 hypothetical protein [Dolichospermum lemmermannii CS-548]